MSAGLDFWSDMLILIIWDFIDMIGVNRCETRVIWREEEISLTLQIPKIHNSLVIL